MTDSSQFIQLHEMDSVPLIVGGSATLVPGTTVYIHCPVLSDQRTRTYDRYICNFICQMTSQTNKETNNNSNN